MGHLMKPLTSEPVRSETRSVQAEIVQPVQNIAHSPPQPPTSYGVMVHVGAKELFLAVFFITLVAVVLFALYGGGDPEAVIAAKDAHIASLEQVNERIAQIAEAGVVAAPTVSVSGVLDAMFKITGIAMILLAGIIFALLRISDRMG